MVEYNIPGWRKPEKVKQRSQEINELAEKIISVAFKKDKSEKFDLQKIRKHNPRTSHPQYITLKTDPKELKKMVSLIAEKIWDFLYETDKDRFFGEVREDIDDSLENIKGYLESFTGGYDKNGTQRERLFDMPSVNDAMNILSESAYSLFEKSKNDLKNMDHTIKEQVRIQPLAHKMIEREKSLIDEIKNIYERYIPEQNIKDHIIYFVSIVFKCSGLYKGKNPYEWMKDRLSEKK